MINLAILLTVHNRKSKTLACLDSIFKQTGLPENLHIQIFLVDDGCSDGTPDAVRAQFPPVHILPGSGNLFWCGGMRLALSVALQEDFDYYLWLNDDTILYPRAIHSLITTCQKTNNLAIVVGSTRDPETNEQTYGGLKRKNHWHPFRFRLIPPSEQTIEAETMNGNCVILPHAIVEKVGNLDVNFSHGFGDYDYGLRARRMGFSILIASGYQGTCTRNLVTGSWRDSEISFSQSFSKVMAPNGLPLKDWATFAKRYAGPLWFLFVVSPYLRVLIQRLRKN